jgi:hypothetical protein
MCCRNTELSLFKFVRYVKERQYANVSLNNEIYRIPTLQHPVLPTTAAVRTVCRVLTVFLQCSYIVLKCPYNVLTVSLQCSYSVLTMFLQCSYSVFTVFLQCSYSILTLSLSVLTVFLHCP